MAFPDCHCRPVNLMRMEAFRPAEPISRLRLAAAVGMVAAAIASTAMADRVELADGRILEGRFAKLPGVIVDPLAEGSASATGEPILMCDDELTRTMVSKRKVVKVEEAAIDPGMERVTIPQRVPDEGPRVAGVGGILETTPFDEFGRRILSLATAGGRVDVVQGITEITRLSTSGGIDVVASRMSRSRGFSVCTPSSLVHRGVISVIP